VKGGFCLTFFLLSSRNLLSSSKIFLNTISCSYSPLDFPEPIWTPLTRLYSLSIGYLVLLHLLRSPLACSTFGSLSSRSPHPSYVCVPWIPRPRHHPVIQGCVYYNPTYIPSCLDKSTSLRNMSNLFTNILDKPMNIFLPSA